MFTGPTKSLSRTAALVSGAVVVSALTGCSNAGDMTCTEFAELGYSEQTSTIWDMIEEQGLDPTSSVMGVVQIGTDVNTFCGVSGLPGDTSPAGKNSSSSIEDGVDWAAYTM